ncbi:MAG: hypothetical protein EXR73_10575 [Myxococcales bacterium]|nr:hypothetical protein [Myxococcales bacterium]
MNSRDAEHALSGAELVPVMQLPLLEAKEVAGACLDADVPVTLGRDDHCTTGCAPKLLLLARAEDAPRIAAVIRDRFQALVALDGAELPVFVAAPDGALPCPACGSAVPDDAAECPDCGLGLGHAG